MYANARRTIRCFPRSRLLAFDEGEKFVAGLLVFAEGAEHGAGDGGGLLLFDATHDHAEMAGFDDDANAFGAELFFDGAGDLISEALLNLQAAGVHVDEARDFAEAEDFFLWNVGDMAAPEEGEQMMFAEAVELDVFDHDHFVVADGESGAVENGVGVLTIAAGEKTQGFLEALGRAAQAFARGIFAEEDE